MSVFLAVYYISYITPTYEVIVCYIFLRLRRLVRLFGT